MDAQHHPCAAGEDDCSQSRLQSSAALIDTPRCTITQYYWPWLSAWREPSAEMWVRKVATLWVAQLVHIGAAVQRLRRGEEEGKWMKRSEWLSSSCIVWKKEIKKNNRKYIFSISWNFRKQHWTLVFLKPTRRCIFPPLSQLPALNKDTHTQGHTSTMHATHTHTVTVNLDMTYYAFSFHNFLHCRKILKILSKIFCSNMLNIFYHRFNERLFWSTFKI